MNKFYSTGSEFNYLYVYSLYHRIKLSSIFHNRLYSFLSNHIRTQKKDVRNTKITLGGKHHVFIDTRGRTISTTCFVWSHNVKTKPILIDFCLFLAMRPMGVESKTFPKTKGRYPDFAAFAASKASSVPCQFQLFRWVQGVHY